MGCFMGVMMKYIRIILCINLVVIGIKAQDDHMREVTAGQLSNMIDRKKYDPSFDVTIINVLNSDAYRDCHIQSSINLPLMKPFKNRVHNRLKSGKWKKDKTIVVYCANATCPLSRYAYQILTKEFGFTNVWSYEGGISDWVQQGYPTIGLAHGGCLKS